MTYTPQQLQQKKQDILNCLGLGRPPVNLTPVQTAEVLGSSINTLSVWRTNGRYNLPYVKVSRRVAYPLGAVAQFLLQREVAHTGEAVGGE